jgi:hypothetical protein
LGFGWDATGSVVVVAVGLACGALALRLFQWD